MSGDSLLEVRGLVKTFPAGGLPWRRRVVQAVSGVDLDVRPGEILSVVGESGSGKSTLARCIVGLTEPTAGVVRFAGTDTASLSRRERDGFRRRVQPVFQDPFSSLDPRWTVERCVREALDAHRIGTAGDRRTRVRELLDQVGLSERLAERLPAELSGGQRQRVGIAAALALEPDLLVADEPVSALDVSVQAQILNLLAGLQRDLGLSILFVAHDLSVVEHISHRIAVMYLGRIVEVGETRDVFGDPRHPYTRALVQAIPHPDPARRLEHSPLAGEIPSPLSPPPGCHFHPRCPVGVPACRTVEPALLELTPGRRTACHVAAAAAGLSRSDTHPPQPSSPSKPLSRP